jgi:hypothetical protein
MKSFKEFSEQLTPQEFSDRMSQERREKQKRNYTSGVNKRLKQDEKPGVSDFNGQ